MDKLRQALLPFILILTSIMAIQAYTTVSQNNVIAQSPAPSVVPAVAKIKGPTQVLAGTLLFLSADDATGDNFKWLIPEELTQTSATCNTSIFFAIPTPGDYTFGLVAANKSADIDVAYHKVKVITHPGNGPPPVEPSPNPAPSFDKIITISKEGLAKLNDPPTASALKLALNVLIQEAGNKSLQELRTETVRLTLTTFLNRKGESLKKEWGQLWVEPIDAAIIALDLKDPKTYVELLKALVKTL